jgi:YHS domain-containing protein
VRDPVCRMEVNPKAPRFKADEHGQVYFFCGPSCLEKFQSRPQAISISGRDASPGTTGPICLNKRQKKVRLSTPARCTQKFARPSLVLVQSVAWLLILRLQFLRRDTAGRI